MKSFLPFLRVVSPSDSASGTGSENKSQKSNTTEDTSMPFGMSSLESLNLSSSSTGHLTPMIVQTALKKMFKGGHFDICVINYILELTCKGSRKSLAYKQLQPLHCIDFADMPVELRNSIPLIVNDLLLNNPVECIASDASLKGVF